MRQPYKLFPFLLFKRIFWWNLFTLLCLTGCVNRSSDLISAGSISIAEIHPELHFEQEVMIVRITQVLEEAQLTNEEKANLFFERGVLYDSLGLWSSARYDFSQAISFNPKMAAAYNYIGLYLLLEDDYDSSIDAFNAVLELDPNYDYSYLNRGLALYYGGRYAEAGRDFLRFYQADKTDPYRALWLYFNELEVNPWEAKYNLVARMKSLSDDFWGTNIVRYFLGEFSLAQLKEKMDSSADANSAQYAEILTESYFYLAKQKLKMNQVGEARSLFRLAIANQVYNFVEYRFAQFELLQLRKMRAVENGQTIPVVGTN